MFYLKTENPKPKILIRFGWRILFSVTDVYMVLLVFIKLDTNMFFIVFLLDFPVVKTDTGFSWTCNRL